MTSLTESASQVGAANLLSVGSRAPSIKVENWPRGQPVRKFERGKVYILEFWPTWCGPCIASMPNLVVLQDKYTNNGVEVVGIAAHEQASTENEARASLDAWLTKSLSNLNYAIAFDYAGEMNKLWLDPSFSVGIPTSFVVDHDGHIAFIGHPTQLDHALPKVLNGSWATSDEAKALDAERINTGRRRKRELSQKRALVEPIFARLEPAMKRKDWPAALSAIEEALAAMRDEVTFRGLHAELLLHKIRNLGAGLPVLRQLVRDAIEKKSAVWMSVAIRQLFDPAKDYSDFPHAERFAMGKELSEHILAANPPRGSDGAKFLSYGAVAQYYYETGKRDRAIELVEVALKWLDAAPASDLAKRDVVQCSLQALASYRSEKLSYEECCSAPQNTALEKPEPRSPREAA
ncbi:TlpA disulfide reductase family protein [Bradyrhizobium canariense]|uniref:Alkyl hydroperoxide reductase n=1 Tax=Bradyrhizobium canariense TaxID=255045 RepID=A0ABX3X9L6_9BRAD|nr:TlpA disulfide reductase family protein [Bradyrhizobium canariense]OSJ18838.1 alkyl hydroperoxide reductase [Bradyrhizobium canariense]OSJ33959.1 alkyl hydroperoxide reductase [Bradyrhizobium canariense]